MPKISQSELHTRFRVLADTIKVFHAHNFSAGMHTRIPQLIIYNEWVIAGRSEKWTPELSHDEHVVPLAALIKISIEKFEKNASSEEVAQFLAEHFKVVKICKTEAKRLDSGKLKSEMPDGWKPGDCPFARLDKEGIARTEA